MCTVQMFSWRFKVLLKIPSESTREKVDKFVQYSIISTYSTVFVCIYVCTKEYCNCISIVGLKLCYKTGQFEIPHAVVAKTALAYVTHTLVVKPATRMQISRIILYTRAQQSNSEDTIMRGNRG